MSSVLVVVVVSCMMESTSLTSELIDVESRDTCGEG
jgi:hypothetical protein